MHVQAQVLRLEEQLTVPSRNRPHLLDLWFSLGWNAGLEEWAREFALVSEGQNTTSQSSGTLELVPMTERGGWIVARGVDLARASRQDIEVHVGRIVTEVNSRCAARAEVAVERPRPTRSWSGRVRSSLEAGSSILGALRPAGRARTATDSASST